LTLPADIPTPPGLRRPAFSPTRGRDWLTILWFVTTTDAGTLRDRYNAFIAGHEVAWELVMAALTIAWVVVSFSVAEDDPAVWAFDIAVWVILGAEFLTRLAASRDRRAYLRGHWIDAIALIPAARALRLLRLFRLIRLVRAFAGIYRALVSIDRFARNRQLVLLFTAWLAVAIICSIALFLAEVDANDRINEPLDALWWGVTTLTTVGYGDVYPVTAEGRLAAGALMILGITLWAAITATITSRLIVQEAQSSPSPADILWEVASLHADGILTDEEYETKRKELVARL
jgi:voltage-gated potassium channel